MSEKRRAKRKINRIRIRFGEGKCDKTAFTSNLSATGFFIRTNRPYPPGTILQFEVQNTNGKVVLLNGRVVHASRAPSQISRVRRSGMGILLMDKSEEYLDFLKNLKRNVPEEAPEETFEE